MFVDVVAADAVCALSNDVLECLRVTLFFEHRAILACLRVTETVFGKMLG
jgi:hypothetical protein